MMMRNPHRGITDLPVELIQHISYFLTPRCALGQEPRGECGECVYQRPGCRKWVRGQSDLSHLSRTCKALRNIVQPLVFTCYPNYESDNGSRQPVRRMIRLTRTFIERPDLAQHLRSVTFTEPLEKLDPADTKIVEDCVLQLGLPALPSHWPHDDADYRLLPLELVLAHTPHLEFLRLPLAYNWQLNTLPRLRKHKEPDTPRPRLLPHLRRLEITPFFTSDHRFDVSMYAVEALIREAPHLEELTFPSPASSASRVPWMRKLRRLAFDDKCAISPQTVTSMLVAAPNLEELSIRWASFEEESDGYPEVLERWTTADAWDAVETRRDTLRVLRLDIRPYPEHGEEMERYGLEDFERLEVLGVGWFALEPLRKVWVEEHRHARVDSFLSAMFPRSIREVTFWAPGWELRAAMERFARVVAVGRYPNLQSVVIAPQPLGVSALEDALDSRWRVVEEGLAGDFGKGGVRFKMKWEADGHWR